MSKKPPEKKATKHPKKVTSVASPSKPSPKPLTKKSAPAPPAKAKTKAPAKNKQAKKIVSPKSDAQAKKTTFRKASDPNEPYRKRAWETLSGKRAAELQPDAPKEVLLHKFRWGIVKLFATSKGQPIIREEKDMALPEKPAFAWMLENKFIKQDPENASKYTFGNKGKQLYNLFFKNKEPRDYAVS